VPKVEIDHVSMKYLTLEGETEALQDICLSIAEGEFVSIVGPSGCGKSTLLSLISGLLKPTRGRILIDGVPLQGITHKLGYMLQQDYLFEWRTIYNNVILGLEIQGKDKRSIRRQVDDLLQRYGLWDFRHHYPHQLSGGMRQRVALIRTLAINPDILLLDEPFAALDYQTRLYLEDEVATILKGEGKTVILVTHDISEAVAMSDRVIVLSRRPGRVKADIKIMFAAGRLMPFATRKAPEFRHYFNRIWEELDIHVEGTPASKTKQLPGQGCPNPGTCPVPEENPPA
jgi:NitT/TauT family transport system ATP-binding protein